MNILSVKSLSTMLFIMVKNVIQVELLSFAFSLPPLAPLYLNVYTIIEDVSISIQNSHLTVHNELSATTPFNKRSRGHKISNISKLQKVHDFNIKKTNFRFVRISFIHPLFHKKYKSILNFQNYERMYTLSLNPSSYHH